MLKISLLFKIIKTIKNWPLYLREKSGMIKDSKIILELRNKAKIEIRPNTDDRPMFNHIWIKEAYTPADFSIEENDIVFDIGAHSGFFSIFAAGLAKNGKIFAFEPEPENFKILEKNIKLNNFQNIFPFCLAIADTNGKRTLDIFSGSEGGHALEMLHPNNADITIGKIAIDSSRLEDFLSNQKIDRIDFLKMNCEGAEYEILFTCPDQVISKIKKISMQYHPIDEKRNENTLKKFLEEKGFKVTIRSLGSMLYAKRY